MRIARKSLKERNENSLKQLYKDINLFTYANSNGNIRTHLKKQRTHLLLWSRSPFPSHPWCWWPIVANSLYIFSKSATCACAYRSVRYTTPLFFFLLRPGTGETWWHLQERTRIVVSAKPTRSTYPTIYTKYTRAHQWHRGGAYWAAPPWPYCWCFRACPLV